MGTALESCVRCQAAARSAGLLCEPCARALTPSALLLPRHIESIEGLAQRAEAWLVDCWGRPHAFPASGTIGRDGDSLRLLTGAVSRLHLEIAKHAGTWRARDLGSRNGSALNGVPLGEAGAELKNRDTLLLADVGFVFISDPLAAADHEPAGIRTQTLAASVGAHGGLAFKLHENPMGGGGVLELPDGKIIDLPLMQLELMQLLLAQWRSDLPAAPEVRGFVTSGYIIASLSWDTADPSPDHLKQLIRRTRQQLEGCGVGIEGRHGAGYRLSTS